MNRLRNTFLQMLASQQVTQSNFARRAGVTESAITKFIQGSIPQDMLFRAIFQTWPEQETKRQLLRAHLFDEIERAGLQPSDYEPALAKNDDSLENDLAIIEQAMRAEPSLRNFIRRTAAIFANDVAVKGGTRRRSRK